MTLGDAALATPLVVNFVGLCTSVAPSALQTGLLVRRGSLGLRELGLLDAQERPITGCHLPTLDPYLAGPARLFSLVDLALNDAAAQGAFEALRPLRTQVRTLLDADLAVTLPNGAQRASLIGAEVADRVNKHIKFGHGSSVRTADATALGQLLPELASELARGTLDAAIIVAAHTDYDPQRIKSLEGAQRLYHEDNDDGLIPGEAASVLVVSTQEMTRSARLPTRAQIHSASLTYEKARPDNDESAFEAAGMTVALHQAYQGAPLQGRRLGWLMSDLNFEAFRVYEYQAIQARGQDLFGPPQAQEFPAHKLGYLGAATMCTHLALAATAWRHGYAPESWMLSMAGDDDGNRSCIVASQ